MEQLLPAEEVAEAFVELLNANKVDYIFLNPGSDNFPVQEAIAKFKASGKRTPEVILCLHESVAMAAAHGYAMISGRPQVVLVHSDVGTQQVGGALHNAQRGRIPIILCAGLAPSTRGADKRGGRAHPVQWLQDRFDQTSIVRDYVKWHYELRNSTHIHHVVQRAFQVASTEPCGPVYLSIPPEVLLERIDGVKILSTDRYAPAISPQADDVTLSRVADILMKAENPLIITGYSGRHPQSVESLVDLAEALGARVVTANLRMNFPTRHPLCSGIDNISTDSTPHIKNSDAILIIDHDTPYFPDKYEPGPEAKIIYIDIDPIKQDMPVWDMPADMLILADSSKAIPALSKIVRQKLTSEYQARFHGRSKRLEKEHQKLRDGWHALAMSKAQERPISTEWLCHCIDEVIDNNTIIISDLVSGTSSAAHQIHHDLPGTLFTHGGANLGWGLGAALGTKLAAPEKTVISLMGDGSFIFGCPTAALWASSAYKIPFLSIIFNNQMYYAPRKSIEKTYGRESFSKKTGLWLGVDILPSPDYALIARGCYAHGSMIEDPGELLPALRNGLDLVRSGTSVVLDIRIERP